MYCRYCGAELPDHAVICTRCGGAVAPDDIHDGTQNPDRPGQRNDRDSSDQFWPRQNPGQPHPSPCQPAPGQGFYAPQPPYGENALLQEIRHVANVTLAWGIAGSFFSLTLYFSFLGVIFSILGLVKANRYRKLAGPETGTALAGKILSIIGLCTGIVMIIVLFVVVGYVAYVMF